MQLFGSVPLQCHELAVDTTTLVRSCVQSAVGMLRDQVESGLRSAQRVEILLTLLCDHDDLKGGPDATRTLSFCGSRSRFTACGIQLSSGEFLQTVKMHLHSMLLTQESSAPSSMKSNWVIKEASNFDALQEGGTFR